MATRLGLNRTHAEADAKAAQPKPQAEAQRRAAHERAKAQAEAEAEAKARRRSEEAWAEAKREHEAHEAHRERVNGKAGKGHPKIDRARVFELKAQGLGVRAIARALGCSHVAILKILREAGGEQWLPGRDPEWLPPADAGSTA